MEHSAQQRWHFRWRILGPYPAPYLEWREGVAADARVIFHPEVAACEVEAQWRADEADAWQQVTLRQCTTGTALFTLFARDGFHAPEGFRVLALIPGEWIACYLFGPVHLEPGQQTPAIGTADGPFADNILLSPGDFRSCGPALEVENLGPSEGSFIEHPAATARLTATAGSTNRRLFVKSPSLPSFP